MLLLLAAAGRRDLFCPDSPPKLAGWGLGEKGVGLGPCHRGSFCAST